MQRETHTLLLRASLCCDFKNMAFPETATAAPFCISLQAWPVSSKQKNIFVWVYFFFLKTTCKSCQSPQKARHTNLGDNVRRTLNWKTARLCKGFRAAGWRDLTVLVRALIKGQCPKKQLLPSKMPDSCNKHHRGPSGGWHTSIPGLKNSKHTNKSGEATVSLAGPAAAAAAALARIWRLHVCTNRSLSRGPQRAPIIL